jgi:hypothetical protein
MDLTIFSFGAGQESTYLLHKLVSDPAFRAKHIKGHLLVVGSDTGDEHPHTYQNVEKLKLFCKYNDVEFYWVTPDMGYHTNTWQSLTGQYKRNSSIGSAAFKQTCTDNLKVKVVDNFVEGWLKKQLGKPDAKRKTIFKGITDIRLILGFAKGEESRTTSGNKFDAVWKKKSMVRYFPLIEDGITRQDCIDYNTINIPYTVWPSNCMRCFYQADQEVLWLHRNFPEKFLEWYTMEQAKLTKYAGADKNYGVYGKVLLMQKLEKATDLYGHWSDEQLDEYKFSHGHCIKSKY